MPNPKKPQNTSRVNSLNAAPSKKIKNDKEKTDKDGGKGAGTKEKEKGHHAREASGGLPFKRFVKNKVTKNNAAIIAKQQAMQYQSHFLEKKELEIKKRNRTFSFISKMVNLSATASFSVRNLKKPSNPSNLSKIAKSVLQNGSLTNKQAGILSATTQKLEEQQDLSGNVKVQSVLTVGSSSEIMAVKSDLEKLMALEQERNAKELQTLANDHKATLEQNFEKQKIEQAKLNNKKFLELQRLNNMAFINLQYLNHLNFINNLLHLNRLNFLKYIFARFRLILLGSKAPIFMDFLNPQLATLEELESLENLENAMSLTNLLGHSFPWTYVKTSKSDYPIASFENITIPTLTITKMPRSVYSVVQVAVPVPPRVMHHRASAALKTTTVPLSSKSAPPNPSPLLFNHLSTNQKPVIKEIAPIQQPKSDASVNPLAEYQKLINSAVKKLMLTSDVLQELKDNRLELQQHLNDLRGQARITHENFEAQNKLQKEIRELDIKFERISVSHRSLMEQRAELQKRLVELRRNQPAVPQNVASQSQLAKDIREFAVKVQQLRDLPKTDNILEHDPNATKQALHFTFNRNPPQHHTKLDKPTPDTPKTPRLE